MIEVGTYVAVSVKREEKAGIVRERSSAKPNLYTGQTGYNYTVELLGKFNQPSGETVIVSSKAILEKDPPRINQAEYDLYMRSKDPARRRLDSGLAEIFGVKDDTEPDGAPVEDDDDYMLWDWDDFTYSFFKYGIEDCQIDFFRTRLEEEKEWGPVEFKLLSSDLLRNELLWIDLKDLNDTLTKYNYPGIPLINKHTVDTDELLRMRCKERYEYEKEKGLR